MGHVDLRLAASTSSCADNGDPVGHSVDELLTSLHGSPSKPLPVKMRIIHGTREILLDSIRRKGVGSVDG